MNKRCQTGKSIPKPELSRRSYLRAAGACIALPFMPSLGSGRAWSAPVAERELPTPSSAPRMVCVGVALGMYGNEWIPKNVGPKFKAPQLIQPLEKLREDFTIFSNVDHPNVTGGHKGMPAFLSGVYQPEQVGQSIVIRNEVTVDQFAAEKIGDANRYSSIQLSATKPNATDLLSWSNKGVALRSQHDPLEVFKQLFVNDRNPRRAAKAMTNGRSVLDLVNEDAKSLTRDLSRNDRQVLDQYMSSVRDVEKGIARQLEWLATPKPRVPKVKERPTTYHQNLDLLYDLLALALQTDSTRIASLMLPGGGIAIDVDGKRIGNYHGQSHHGKDPAVIKQLVAIERLHTASLARFLTRLKETPTDQGNLLDCTQVLFGSGLGNGSSHSNRDLPILLAGGGHKHKGHIRGKDGTRLTNLFVSMLRKMDINVDSFADSNGDFSQWLG